MSLKLLEWIKPSPRPIRNHADRMLEHEHRKAEELRKHLNNQRFYRQ